MSFWRANTGLDGCLKFKTSAARSRKQKAFATRQGESTSLKARDSVRAAPQVLSLQYRPRRTIGREFAQSTWPPFYGQAALNFDFGQPSVGISAFQVAQLWDSTH
jgi:hypothetical protein